MKLLVLKRYWRLEDFLFFPSSNSKRHLDIIFHSIHFICKLICWELGCRGTKDDDVEYYYKSGYYQGQGGTNADTGNEY